MSHERLSFNQFAAPGLPFDEAVRLTAAAGFAGLGVLRSTVDELGPRRVAAVLGRYGIEPTSVCVAFGLVDADPGLARRKFDLAVDGLRDAAELGVPLVVVVGGPMAGLSIRDARRQVSDALGELDGEAARIGGHILVEPLHPAQASLSALCSLREAVDLVDRLDHCGVVLDTWHVWAEPGLDDTIAASAAAIEIVHLADWSAEPSAWLDRELPGAGIGDLPSIRDLLRRHGFAGWWEVEVLSEKYQAQGQSELPHRCATAARRLLSGRQRSTGAVSQPDYTTRR
ncbi:sugar phosphate isomerase/epimerase family protein [Streptomyces sp. MI02-7b]|uniref:sugar phosphate isomerase/epimerase family protein n=1 Tax=Streptomyces sp. MI02-7b TaxID=462941 RepID=UPI0029A687BA|nr:sugar phosphate isomerase/epimerase family protein [Streptomyces sp. MI02-7b]MDX3078375.1 sugar phosphate isomerase/epimerase [Streptomyces sp. MI02-7b]